MSYHYLEDFATADIAFEATGSNLNELFIAAADATMNVMIEDLGSIEPNEVRLFDLRNKEADMLLFDFLQEIIYYKDARQLLLRVKNLEITEEKDGYALRATARGERLDPERHEQRTDVKAVTLHHFTLQKNDDAGWKALVILDV
jgi:SHS2 domain-containing protein